MQQVFTEESLTRADRASRLISGRDVLFGAAQTTRQYHADGYVNVLNQYGTQNDTTEQYEYSPEGGVMDIKLNQLYEGDGLFAKIIDTPADECVKQGFSFGNLSDEKVESFLRQSLDDLDWEDVFSTAVKWSRLFGGAIGVMLVDDGGELDEPLNWSSIKSIDEVRIYERAIVQPDYTSLYRINPQYDGGSHIQSKFGMPQYYTVMSQYGSFVVHESRCLVFRNGRLPERTSNPLYQIWGMPEYIRIKRAMRDATVAHGDATKLLERSVQAVYSMKGLADECSTEEGENRILKRLQTIDTSRGLMNTISIDADGENYDFKTFSFSGVSDVVDTSCNLLSALTNIPQTILFGRSPAGMSATGESDMENFYNFVERIQKTMLRPNLQVLLDVIIQAGVHSGELDKAPDIHLEFNPLWSLSEAEQAQVESTKAQTASTRANTAIAYVNNQILDPTEVRRKLADSGEFNVEDIITEDDVDEDDILNAMNAPTQQSANPAIEGELANKPQQLQQQNRPPEQPDDKSPPKPKLLTEEHFSKYSDGESSRHSWDSVNTDGGPGSGNFNHGGRPGEVGGSAPSAESLNSTMSAACKASKDGDKDKAYSLAEKFLSDVPVGSTIKMQSWNDECPELKKIDNNVYQNTLTGEKLDKDSALAQYDYSDTDDDSMRVTEVGSGSDDTAASSDLDRRLAWGNKISEEREKMSAAKPAKQAMMLNDTHFLSYDDAVKAMKDGTAGEKLNDYFDIMDENGDPTPTKPVSKQLLGFGSNVSEEYAGDWSNARLGYIEKYTGQSKEQAEKTKSELDTWFGGGWSKADTATLDKYIDEDHAYDGELYRGLHFENDGDFDSFIAQCEPGAVITNKNGMNSSWSSSEGMARIFAHSANRAVDSVILHCVKNRTTSPVSYLSSKGEDECLSHSKAQWTVLHSEVSETGQGGRKADVYIVEKGEYAE